MYTGIPATLGAGPFPVKISWPAARDAASGVLRYELSQSSNGGTTYGVVATTSATSLLRSLTPGTATYRFRVRAQDKAGNWSAYATGVSFNLDSYSEASAAAAYTGTGWTNISQAGSYGNAVERAKLVNNKVRLTFKGREIIFVSTKAADRGKAQLCLDAAPCVTVDLYSPTTGLRQAVYRSAGLSPTLNHTLEVRVLGTRNAASTGTVVDVDAFIVLR